MAKSSRSVKRSHMRKLALLLCCAAAGRAPAQEARRDPTRPAAAATLVPARVVGDEVAVEYRPQTEGQALIEIAAPAGARVDVREGQALIGRDTVPMAIKAEADHWYVVAARLPSGAAREAKVQARAGQVASLRFVDVPQGPQAMPREAFKGFLQALDEEPGDQAKLNRLRSAAARQWFTAAMAAPPIDHLVHPGSRLPPVALLQHRMPHGEHAFWLYQHFTYREDKAKVEENLEH